MNQPAKRASLFNIGGASVSNGEKKMPESFAFVVTGYDVTAADEKDHFITGKKLGTDEEVRVALMPLQTAGKPRPSVKALSLPRKDRLDPGVALGGTILVQTAFLNDDGIHRARWMNGLSHAPGEAEVFIAKVTTTLAQLSPRSKKAYSRMQIVCERSLTTVSAETKEAMNVFRPLVAESAEVLQAILTEVLEANATPGLRLIAKGAGENGEDVFDGSVVYRKQDKKPSDIAADFMKALSDDMKSKIGSSVIAEVIPVTTIWMGPDAAETAMKSKTVGARLAQFNEEIDRGTKKTNGEIYLDAIVAVRRTGSPPIAYFTHVEPLRTSAPIHGLREAIAMARTEHFSPAQPEPIAAAEESLDSDQDQGMTFGDGPIDNSDLMASLENAPDMQDGAEMAPPPPQQMQPAASRYARQR